MSRHNIEDLLDRYLRKETSASENEQVEAWLDAHQQNQNEWFSFNEETRSEWLDDLFADVKINRQQPAAKIISLKRRNNFWLKASSIAALLVIGLAILWQWPALRSWNKSDEFLTLTVAPNQLQMITLDDSSKIWINQKSNFKYPKAFNGKIRSVYLQGEAYFDIKHDASRPFVVHTGKVTTTVLGTSFNIKTNPTNASIVVSVNSGKVGVNDGSRLLGYITPGRQISYDVKKQSPVESEADLKEVLSWQNTEIHFEDLTFAEAAKELEKRFNVPIKFANDKVGSCRFTGTIPKGKDLNQILKIICAFIDDARFQQNKDKSITISGKGCN
jgi:transmembrane sensor